MYTILFSFLVHHLTKKRRISDPEDPVAKGYWGKPPPLVEAKNDFLCLQATLISTRQSHNSITLGINFFYSYVTKEKLEKVGLGANRRTFPVGDGSNSAVLVQSCIPTSDSSGVGVTAVLMPSCSVLIRGGVACRYCSSCAKL